MNGLMKLKASLLYCCILLLSVGCSGSKSSAGSAISAGVDPRGQLIKAMRAMLAATSYRSRMLSSGSGGTSSSTVLEFVAPDRFHMSRETETPGRGAKKQETIIIGNDTWMKMDGAPWQRFPANLGDVIKQLRNPKVIEELTQATEVKFIGPDVLDGSPTMVYQYTLSDSEGNGFRTTAKTWVGVADGLPRKTEGETDMNITGKTTHIKSTTTYFDYGADIKLEPPV